MQLHWYTLYRAASVECCSAVHTRGSVLTPLLRVTVQAPSHAPSAMQRWGSPSRQPGGWTHGASSSRCPRRPQGQRRRTGAPLAETLTWMQVG